MRFLGRPCLSVVALAILLFGVPSYAQTGGRITGVVRDAAGAPVEAARILATNTATGAARRAITAADGSYTISGVAPGNYTVIASLVGFRRVTRTNVQVSPNATVDFVLSPQSLQAITVTAQLREQELADVPFSVAAPTASLLRERGADNLEAIASNIAGFSVQNLGPGQSQVAMRGASSGQIARDQPGVKEQVSSYLDDTPISLSLFTPDLDLFDLSRVEVLRGPQGTLFGAGALSGTVRYITNQPELGVRSNFGELGGNWIGGGGAGANVKVGANVPMGEQSAARFVVFHNRIGGYMDAVQPDLTIRKNINTGTKTGARAAFLVAPNDRLSITPRIVFQNVEMNGWNRIDTFNILANPYTTSRPAVKLGERKLFATREPYSDDYVLGDVNLRYNFGPANFTSVTSYSWRDILVVRDASALYASIVGGTIGLPEDIYTLPSPLDDKTKVHGLTQEMRFSGGGDRTKWLMGGFYSTNKRGYGQSVYVPGFDAATGIGTVGLRAKKDELFYSDLHYDLKQYALFGEGTAAVGTRLELTAGLRYYNFDEDRLQVFDGIFGNNNNGTSLVSQPGSISADGFAPRFIASFKANDRFSLNAQASRGFRLGGINDPINEPICSPADLATFGGRDKWKDETAWNYEVGTKSNWMGGRAALNLSAFYMDIRDLQLTVTAGSCSSRLVFNVPKAASQGGEIELSVTPNSLFDFSIAGTVTDSKVKSTLTSTDGSGNVTVVAGIKDGNRLPSVPKVQGSASATFHRQLRPGSQGFLTSTAQYVGSHFTQIDDHGGGQCPAAEPNCPFGTVDLNSFGANTIGAPLNQAVFRFNPELPAYSLVNLRAGVIRANWETALFINNVADTRALLALDRERGTRARVGYLTNQPRTLGVNMRFNY